MYTYFLMIYDCGKLDKLLSKKCKVSFFAQYITIAERIQNSIKCRIKFTFTARPIGTRILW